MLNNAFFEDKTEDPFELIHVAMVKHALYIMCIKQWVVVQQF